MFVELWEDAHSAMVGAFVALLIGDYFNWWNVTGVLLFIPLIILAALLIADAGYLVGYMVGLVIAAFESDDTDDTQTNDHKDDDHA